MGAWMDQKTRPLIRPLLRLLTRPLNVEFRREITEKSLKLTKKVENRSKKVF